MLKSLRILLVCLVVGIALANGQENGVATIVGVQDVALPGANNNNTDTPSSGLILSAIRLPFTILATIFSQIEFFLSPVKGLIDFFLSPIFALVDLILYPIRLSIGVPLQATGTLLNDIAEGVIGNSSRTKRNAMESIIGTMMPPIFSLPYRILRTILDALFAPLGFIYGIVTWPLHFIVGNNTGSSQLQYSNSLATSSISNDLINSIGEFISSFLSKLSDSSQEAAIKALKTTWQIIKDTLLPNLDKLLVKAASSSWIPEDIIELINNLHSTYNWLRLFGIL